MSKLHLLSTEDAEIAAKQGWQLVVVVDAKTQKATAEAHPMQQFDRRIPHVPALRNYLTQRAASANGLERRAVHAITKFNQGVRK